MKTYYDEKIKDYICHVSDLIRVTSVKPLENYKLFLSFSNGEKKVYDASPLLEDKLFSILKNVEFFKKVYVAYGSIMWSDELDIAPENLYEDSQLVESA